jgi:predicted dehydrogenase
VSAPGAPAAATRGQPLRFGLVGCGNIAARHAQALCELPETALCAVVDLERARAEKFAAEYGAQVLPDVAALAGRDDVDAVMLCLPADRHAEAGLVLAAAGKHVLCEKPIDVDPERARRLVQVARERAVTLSVVSQNRFGDDVLWLRQAIQSGALGRPVLIQVESLWQRDQAYYDGAPGRGRTDRREGGVLLNQAVHGVDLMLWLFGEAASVGSHAATLTHQLAAEDTIALSLAFRSGALGTCIASTSSLQEPERVEVRCERATARLVGGIVVQLEHTGELALRSPPSRAAPKPPASDRLELFRRQHRDFARAVAARSEPSVTGPQALGVLELILAAYRSAESGRREPLPGAHS